MNTYHRQQKKEVIVMDADGSKSSDDSIPLVFSGKRLGQDRLTRSHMDDPLLDDLLRR
jgi:hypothetical protein